MKIDRVGNIVLKVMGDLSAKRPATQDKIFRVWESVCDRKAFRHTAVVGLKDECLFINVDSPAWLFQINFQKRKILRTLKEEIPEITNIRFRIGKVK